MKAKIDIDKFIASLIKYANETSSAIRLDDLIDSLEDQGLTCKDGEIVEIEKQPSEAELIGMGGLDEEWTRENYLTKYNFDYNQLKRMIEEYGDRTASNILQNIEQKIKYWEERK